MSSSNVTNIDSLEDLHRAILQFTDEVRQIAEDIKANTHRTEDAFSHGYPAYWKRQISLAEQRLDEAKDQLAAKTSSPRPQDTPAATEERKRVRDAQARLRCCQEKHQRARQWSLKISRDCDQLLSPLSEILDQCDSVLPPAASELRKLINHLRAYADQKTEN